MATLLVWRHPKPVSVAGRCIGRTDVAVDRRKTKRLAHRIRRRARREGWPHVVFTSPLRRCADVGRCLARWGWRHHIDVALSEMDFGDWDGHRWDDIGAAAVDAWCRDFGEYRAGGGESVARLLHRCAHFLETRAGAPVTCLVGHAGWISAAQWLVNGQPRVPTASEWPAALPYAHDVLLKT